MPSSSGTTTQLRSASRAAEPYGPTSPASPPSEPPPTVDLSPPTSTLSRTTTTTVTYPGPPPSTPPPATENAIVPVVPVPTPEPRTCPTPGTYTFPATTITVTETTTVCGAASTTLRPGSHTFGGVTTVVEKATTVVCPVATVQTRGSVTTSTLVQTTYVCPTPGTYTIAPMTTDVKEEKVVVYPVPTSYNPGTYTAPQLVVTVTVTGYVTYCPFTSVGLPTAPAYTPPEPTVEAAEPTAEAAEPPAPVAPPKESSYSQPSAPSTKPGAISSNNDQYGITYTPYEPSNGQCKPANEVERDIALLKKAGFTTVRVYSTDCNTLESVGNACQKHGLGMIVGVFVKDSGCSPDTPEIKEQIRQLSSWDKWDLVKLVVVGNEAIMNKRCTPTQLRTLVTTVKSMCKYKGLITISETLSVWQQKDVSSALCDVVSVTGANIHPYFNADVTPETAGQFVAGQLRLLDQICGKESINLECGWPTRGNCNGKACPGKEAQKVALKSIRNACGNKTVFFSFMDDMWKDPGSCGCEQSWGSVSYFSPDASMSSY
ncbi:hypothetical protein DCS_08001 [Drechmeria coniospora]|uniref:Probable beta-glucosidase btgE n=1 Tax=Drechmeria coniospora TaxID=98403 RepID=A0A151GG11_DRECN|nr:hypothetical protein DCS_08001 [Drechmeria coniospora]KYK56035.1 hypothetical protein DCS_08001 [Drechmeria coniospora]